MHNYTYRASRSHYNTEKSLKKMTIQYKLQGIKKGFLQICI